MSRKNDYLLSRNGRNQFDVTSDDYPLSPTLSENFKEVKNEFIENYKDSWLGKFEGLNKKQTWKILYEIDRYNYTKMSLNQFYKEVKEPSSIKKYLLKFLFSNKEFSLDYIGCDKDQIQAVMKNFNSRYYQ